MKPRSVVLWSVVAAGALHAQAGGLAVRPNRPDPEYRVSRFDESWPMAKSGASGVRQLKHIPLGLGDAAWMTLGGSMRYRGSSYGNFSLSDKAAMQDDYSELRTLLSADLRVGRPAGRYARLFVELRDAQGFGRTLPGGVRSSEADRLDWQNVFAEVGRGTSSVRYGRQELALGRERLVGVSDWANSRRSFEGARAMSVVRGLRLDAFDGRVVAVRIDAPNRPDSTTHFRMAVVSTAVDRPPGRSVRPSTWQAYAMQLRTQHGVGDRTTVGARSIWRAPLGGAQGSLEVEAASQRGHLGVRSVNAWFSVVEGIATWRAVRWAPSVIVGVDAGSGTGADSARRADVFQPPYATSHGFTGIADVFGRGNLLERRIGFGLEPRRSVQLQGFVRRFARMRVEDGVYTKSNTLMRAAAGSRSRAVGDEFDATVSWQATKQFKVQGGAALVLPGAFFRETGGATRERYAFVSTTVTF